MPIYRDTNKIPESGQFVMIWKNQPGAMWSRTLRADGYGDYEYYDVFRGDWKPVKDSTVQDILQNSFHRYKVRFIELDDQA